MDCAKPCHYLQYKIVRGNIPSRNKRGNSLTFALLAFDDKIQMETEELIYPGASLVAEIGGTLGLFLGFSFMVIWDGMEHTYYWFKPILRNIRTRF